MDPFTVKVDAHGSVTTENDRVRFNATASVHGSNVGAIKSALARLSAEFQKKFAEIVANEKIKIDGATLSTSPSIVKQRVYNSKTQSWVEKGYMGSFNASFESYTPDEASTIYDVLTNIDGFEVAAPVFFLKHQENFQRQALQEAHQRLTERFEVECNILGKNVLDYEIVSWKVDYQERKSHDMYAGTSMVEGSMLGQPGDIEVQAGKAVVTVYLTAIFKEKNSVRVK